MPKIVDYDIRKLQIANTSILLITKNGYNNVHMKDITQKCNMGRTTIYKYFKNKKEIAMYILELNSKLYHIKYSEINSRKDLDYTDKILKIFDYLITDINGISLTQVFFDFYHPIFDVNTEIETKLIQKYDLLIDSISNWLKGGIKSKEFVEMDTLSMSIMLFGMLESASIGKIINRQIDTQSVSDSIKIIIKGLLTHNGG